MSRRGKKSARKNLNKIKVRNSTRVSLVLLSLVAFAISSANFSKVLSKEDVTTVKESVYTYQNEYKADYNVNIKENPFIEEVSLPAGQTYVTELIDSIDMDINYNYTASSQTDMMYSYKIDAIVSGTYVDNSSKYNVWNKTYNLKTVDYMETDKINLQEKLIIDFQKYNQEVKDFKQTLGMALDANLYIKLTVNTTTVVNKKVVKNEYVSNFSISLGDKIAVVDGKNKDIKVNSVQQEDVVTNTKLDTSKLIINFSVMIISIYTIYYIKFKTKKHFVVRNEYRLELNRILKSCQDRIVIVKNKIDTTDETIIDVNDFGELIKLSEELYKPILCWMSEDINNEQAWFSILSNKARYRYILKNSERSN